MTTRGTRRTIANVGEIALLVYLAAVIGVAVMRATMGYPAVTQLASSPDLIAHGEWWRLITSAFVIDGPPVPQLVAIAVLGSLGIYMGGSWVFWLTAIAAHILGTLVAYAGFAILWAFNHAIDAQFLDGPDYGVSLIWCAALGVFAALCWFGDRSGWRKPLHPAMVVVTIIIMAAVTFFSDDMATIQHVVSYLVGFGIMTFVDRKQAARQDPHLHHALERQTT